MNPIWNESYLEIVQGTLLCLSLTEASPEDSKGNGPQNYLI